MIYTALQLIGILIVAFVAFWSMKWLMYCYQLKSFRGPASFPLIGCCYDSGFFVFYKHMMTLRKKYGKIFSFFSFHKPLLVISDPVVARRILSDPKTFYKGADYTESFDIAFGKGLVTSNGEDHRKGRELFGKYFIRASVAKFCDDFNRITKKMIGEFLEGENSKQGAVVNIEEFFARLALRNFMYFSCHIDTSSNPTFEKHICHTVSKGSYAMVRMILLKEPYWSICPNAKIMMEFNAVMKQYFNQCIQDRQDRIAAGEVFDDALTTLMNESTPLSPEHKFDHFKTMISAGHDTTAFFMSYLAYLLARNPHVQQKLYDYLQEKVGDKEVITADDFAELKYLQYVMMETLRMYAIIPVVTRECGEDVHIKEADVDIVLPKNITLLIPMIVMNKDEELWENPNEFNPSRFESKSSNDFTSAKQGFFPFSYGSRTCIGNTLAQIESAIAFIHLLRKFVIEEDQGFRPNIRAGISLTTSNGINVRLRYRQ